MLDSIRFRCPSCDHVFYQSVAYLTGQIKGMKQGKVIEVCKQLHEKRGPFYNRWKVAMHLRGPQMRCKDCVELDEDDLGIFCGRVTDEDVNQNPGAFACSHFVRRSID